MKKIVLPLVALSALAAVAFAFVPQQTAAKTDCGAKAEAQEKECCGGANKAKLMAQQGDKEECCKSTAEKPMAKGDEGCCNAKGAPAKFKVWAGTAYKYFGCEESAEKGRMEAVKSGVVPVGKVQAVVGKVSIS